MTFLDVRTVIFSELITDALCAIVLIFLWLQNRRRYAGMLFWVADFIFQSLAVLFIILRGSIPDWVSIGLSSPLVIAGAYMGYLALAGFVGKRSPQVYNYIFLVIFGVIHVYFTGSHPNLDARNLNVSVGLLVICSQCTWILLQRGKTGLTRITRVVGGVFAVFCLVSVIRIFVILANPQPDNDLFKSGLYETLILLIFQILLILLTFGLALMVNRRLLVDVKSQEEKFTKAFHSSPYAILITRFSDGLILDVNRGFEEITGYLPSEAVGKTIFDLNLWVKEADRQQVLTELSARNEVQGKEFEFRAKSGRHLTGLYYAEILTVENDQLILSSINDITERDQAEQALRESEEKFRKAFLTSPDAININRLADGLYVSINNGFSQIMGYGLEEVIGKTSHELNIWAAPEDRQALVNGLLKNGEVKDLEARFQAKNGEIHYGLMSAAVFVLDNVPHIMSITRDITERKLAEQEIHRLNESLELRVRERTVQLEAANQELEAFAYSVSHDLRAPLRGIDGWSLALLEDYNDQLDETGKKYLERVRSEAQRLGQLIDDMLQLSRVTRTEMQSIPVDLSALAETIIARLKLTQPDRQVEVIIQPGLKCRGDATLLGIVLTNLFDNAWKFSAKCSEARIEFGQTEVNGNQTFFVRDNGVGFDMVYAQKLFGAFQRLHKVSEYAGTGIGLATVQRIVRRHGGQVWAEAQVDHGATFYFTLEGFA
jgi:PAS domain S-box-containing protein